MPVLHLFEDLFDHELAAISLDDLDVVPILPVGDEDVFTKIGIGQLLGLFGVDGVFHAELAVSGFLNLHIDDMFQILATQDFLALTFQGFPGWRPTACNNAVNTVFPFLMRISNGVGPRQYFADLKWGLQMGSDQDNILHLL